MTSAHSTRNTSIRTRKIRGEDSLLSSISISERAEGPEGIAGVIRCEKPFFGSANMAQRGREKRSEKSVCGRTKGELPVETRALTESVFYKSPMSNREFA